MGILSDVGLGGGQANAFLQGDQAFLLQQQQGAGFVGGVVGNANLDGVSQGDRSGGQNQQGSQDNGQELLHVVLSF